MTTSKLILLGSWLVSIILTLTVIIGAFTGANTSDITIIAGLAWGELTAAHGFYFWKARHENRSKYAMQLIKSFADEYGIDAVTNLASVILQE